MDALLKKMRNPEELGLPPVGADSHAHLDGKGLYENFEEVLERAKAAGVALIGNVFLDIEAWKRTRERFEAHPEIFFILGQDRKSTRLNSSHLTGSRMPSSA